MRVLPCWLVTFVYWTYAGVQVYSDWGLDSAEALAKHYSTKVASSQMPGQSEKTKQKKTTEI